MLGLKEVMHEVGKSKCLFKEALKGEPLKKCLSFDLGWMKVLIDWEQVQSQPVNLAP